MAPSLPWLDKLRNWVFSLILPCPLLPISKQLCHACKVSVYLLSHPHCISPTQATCHPLPGLTQWLPNGLPGSRLGSSSLSPDIFTLQLKQASFLKYKSCNIVSLLKTFSDSPLPFLRIKFFMWYSRSFITGRRAPLLPRLQPLPA